MKEQATDAILQKIRELEVKDLGLEALSDELFGLLDLNTEYKEVSSIEIAGETYIIVEKHADLQA
eukprot:CAMPEP_0170512576 /NCGR_PEP_ID=MMETSP0208-20121228/66926_1 /TAXON_ID=197538 /ORGANISM="Strombidium inclinatum, Strain S3" /LENGTH=64 /DNA_ID=CAMNT_0010796221 /DNA_START=1774 /DNA_END=1968 /DNA_ORIENTATION=-